MTRKRNIIVVGNGLFGSVAATLARAHGHNVTVVAESRKYEASPASGCVLAPSWLSSLPKDEVADAMGVLGSLYKLHPLDFTTHLGLSFKAQRVHTADVLLKPDLQARVTEVGDGWVRAVSDDGRVMQKLSGHVLLCTGVWGQDLAPSMPPVKGLYGCSLRLPGQMEHPRLSVYAPYRQAVAFNMDKRSVWFGDGTALIAKTWDAEERARVAATMGRAQKVTGLALAAGTKFVVGARPYVEGHKAGYFARVGPKVWVSNGGAKNGTVLAASQALKFLKEVS